ncbi:MAG: response regulator [Desulfobacteraceae bacterium]|nr:MAG: response regulator [Desulfobacteraceae bacterium]
MNRSSAAMPKQDSETNPLLRKEKESIRPWLPILLAEDDPISRMMMKKALNNEGYEVTSAENGYQALKIFNQQEFPIIITDWIMPEMDGLELCRSIRSMTTTGYVFIMILTTNDAKEDIAIGLDAGADDYLTKPFHPLELFARLKAGSRIIALERSLRESNTRQKNHIQFIESLINTMPSPVFYKDKQGLYLGYNKACQEQILGVPAEALIGREWSKLKDDHLTEVAEVFDAEDEGLIKNSGRKTYEARIKCMDGRKHEFLFHKATFSDVSGQAAGIVGVLLDLTEKNELLRRQLLNINLARGILKQVNGAVPRKIAAAAGIFFEATVLAAPCHAEGGDHFFIKRLGETSTGQGAKTVISLKDQSGHEVGCILRSIITDLLHHDVLDRNPAIEISESMIRLNRALCGSGLFSADDFVTAITVEIDHRTLKLKYASAGHPAFLITRSDQVFFLPDTSDLQGPPLGILENAAFTEGEYQLKAGDKLIFYTDGLTEMPQKNKDKILSVQDLQKRIRKIIVKSMELSAATIGSRLLKSVAKLSGETVIAEEDGKKSTNSSADDVTIICVDILKTK